MDFSLERTSEILRNTPSTLSALLSGLGQPWLRSNEGPDTFSPFDVVGHLIDAEETNWIPRARIIRAGGAEPRFGPFDRFRHKGRNTERSLESLLAEFADLRKASLEELHSWHLNQSDLDTTGIHPEFGNVSLRQLLSTWTVHDLAHIAQIVRTMSKQYRDAVGPWAAFLPILKDRERA